MKKTYTAAFKASIVQKVCTPGGPNSAEVSRTTGVPYPSIRRWVLEHGSSSEMKYKKRTPEAKLKIISETLSLSEPELGEYLRKHGLHKAEVVEWKSLFFEANRSAGRPKTDPKVKVLQKEKKDLERNVRRKDKALAEMSARIVLVKKSRLLWGMPEDDEQD